MVRIVYRCLQRLKWAQCTCSPTSLQQHDSVAAARRYSIDPDISPYCILPVLRWPCCTSALRQCRNCLLRLDSGTNSRNSLFVDHARSHRVPSLPIQDTDIRLHIRFIVETLYSRCASIIILLRIIVVLMPPLYSPSFSSSYFL